MRYDHTSNDIRNKYNETQQVLNDDYILYKY